MVGTTSSIARLIGIGESTLRHIRKNSAILRPKRGRPRQGEYVWDQGSVFRTWAASRLMQAGLGVRAAVEIASVLSVPSGAGKILAVKRDGSHWRPLVMEWSEFDPSEAEVFICLSLDGFPGEKIATH